MLLPVFTDVSAGDKVPKTLFYKSVKALKELILTV